jgi:uncharacterized protein
VANSRNQLRINIGFLLNQVIGYSREFHFDYPVMDLSPDLLMEDFSGLVRIHRTPQGLLANGEFMSTIRLDCVRCLDTFHQTLHATFDELYAFSKRTATDSGLILPDDGYIDLQPIVREYLMIEIPISPVCKQDCLGLCVICGANKNITACEHGEPQVGVVKQ